MARWLLLGLGLALVGCKKDAADVEAQSGFTLTIDDPAAAAWVSDGRTRISGSAFGLTDVTVNDAAVEMDGSNYLVEIPLLRGINVLEARGVDGRDDTRFIQHSVIAGEFDDPGHPVEDAMDIRVNQGGLDTITDAIAVLVEGLDIAGALTAINPVYEDSYGIFGLTAVSIAADIGGVWFDNVKVKATPYDGELELAVSLMNFSTQVPVYGTIVGIAFDTDVWLYADEVEVVLWAGLDARQGKLRVDVTGSEVNLYGFAYDVSLLPRLVEDYLLVDTIRGTIEDTVQEQLITQVPPLLEEQLEALDLSFETELLGTTVSIAADFARASVDPDGVAIAADVNVDVPSSGDLTYKGFLAARGGKPSLSVSDDVSMALSDDLMNRVLFEVWRGGLLDLTLSTEDGSLDPILLSQLGTDTGTITVHALLPPVVIEPDGTGELVAQLGELMVTVDAPGASIGDHVELAAALTAGLDLGIEDGVLGLDLKDADLKLAVRDNSWGGVNNEELATLLKDLLPLEVLLAVANIEFPLPELGGIGISSGTATRDPSTVHTSVSLSMAR